MRIATNTLMILMRECVHECVIIMSEAVVSCAGSAALKSKYKTFPMINLKQINANLQA